MALLIKKTLSDCDVVFVDPDNGIKWEDPGPPAVWSHKHIYWSEILDYLNSGKSVVCYHHLNRNGSHAEQIQSGLATLNANGHPSWGVRYRRGTSRVFFVIANPKHRDSFRENLLAFSETWSDHTELNVGAI